MLRMQGHHLTSRFLTLVFILLICLCEASLVCLFFHKHHIRLELGHLSLFRIISIIIITSIIIIIIIVVIIIVIIIATIRWINPQQVLTVPFWG